MDAIMVEIKSKHAVRPSYPTPYSLRHLKLSLLDQLSPPEYVPMIFYYADIDDRLAIGLCTLHKLIDGVTFASLTVNLRAKIDPPLSESCAGNLLWLAIAPDSRVGFGECGHIQIHYLGKFHLYEADFGWGKLVWVSSAGLVFKNVVVLIESRYGDGIEAWVTMEEKDMGVFERNEELLALASATESPSCMLLNSRL
ncbi:(13S,14R)-1,13-dihydroxy-N-methylcanadine 13-O-acetyltransferase AT1-like [Rhodamnia argentea]|uniref:(13S,14R)-1,13-dihydroxy-N-methylcanadine 13-O-acetyltransferase AT1-like n=1 Tax=Rhodamnia argentea TaxID=178133 RepID=A0ABM3HPV5_9MYRT|nr:(13S,14R)-1,13-dihydroxy-N-methylcanadine 13-O-acetyltransferase AT1-like [Rhodamnia argentea]